MNTRILRMIDRRPIATPNGPWRHPAWRIAGLGQLQPVLVSPRDGARGITLRIEGAIDGRCCWYAFPLATHKRQAKAHLAVLEWHNARGTRGPAAAAHVAGQAAGVYR